MAQQYDSDQALHELLTVDDVAALLKVSRSWVYEHTRARMSPAERLPFIKMGKYVRFQSRAVVDFLSAELQHEEPARGKDKSLMARRKRQYGRGCLLKRRKGWAIRWRETEIAPDGSKKKALRYETLGEVTRKQASDALAQRMATAGSSKLRCVLG